MKVSVVTVNYNHKYFPKLHEEALERSSCDFDFEIIYVDNASSDPESIGFLEQAARSGRLNFVKSERNLGFAGGNNLGAASASGEYIFILNPDTAVQSDTLQKMVDYLENENSRHIGMLGPQLFYSDGTIQESCRRDMGFFDLVLKRTWLGRLPFFRNRVERYVMRDFDHNKTQDVELITGAAMMLSRKVFGEVGGFDERYFLFMEDFDLCKKVRKAGYRIVYYPQARVEHYHKRLSGGNFLTMLTRKVFWLHVQSAVKYFWKWRADG
jgi:GT2 family glycosyltransferase